MSMTRYVFVGVLAAAALGAQDLADDRREVFVRAAREGDRAMVVRLIAEGVDVNTEGPRGGTALVGAAERGHLDIARVLLEHGADPDKIPRPDPSTGVVAMTPLMAAAVQGHADVVDLLISYGADASIQVGETALYEQGATALFLATVKGHGDVVSILTRAATSGERLWEYGVIIVWILMGVVILTLPAECRPRLPADHSRTLNP